MPHEYVRAGGEGTRSPQLVSALRWQAAHGFLLLGNYVDVSFNNASNGYGPWRPPPPALPACRVLPRLLGVQRIRTTGAANTVSA